MRSLRQTIATEPSVPSMTMIGLPDRPCLFAVTIRMSRYKSTLALLLLKERGRAALPPLLLLLLLHSAGKEVTCPKGDPLFCTTLTCPSEASFTFQLRLAGLRARMHARHPEAAAPAALVVPSAC